VALACDAASQVVIAAGVGFFGPPGSPLHSHIAGVVPGGVGRGVGRALKLHQRAWSLERGVDQITWTYDPLVARNAWFNLVTLGARADAYYPDHYGVMTDGLNAGQASDRMLIRWDLRRDPSPADPIAGARHTVLADVEGRPGPVDVEVPGGCVAAEIAVPGDIEALRLSDRELAIAWRQATRSAFVPLLGAGWQVTGIEWPARYLLTRAHRSEPTDQEHR
jgi:predicted GNAT superfamily acetyltransferase